MGNEKKKTNLFIIQSIIINCCFVCFTQIQKVVLHFVKKRKRVLVVGSSPLRLSERTRKGKQTPLGALVEYLTVHEQCGLISLPEWCLSINALSSFMLNIEMMAPTLDFYNITSTVTKKITIKSFSFSYELLQQFIIYGSKIKRGKRHSSLQAILGCDVVGNLTLTITKKLTILNPSFVLIRKTSVQTFWL